MGHISDKKELEGIWRTSGRHLEASGGIWEASGDIWRHLKLLEAAGGMGGIWEASGRPSGRTPGRQLGGIWGTGSQGAPQGGLQCLRLNKSMPLSAIIKFSIESHKKPWAFEGTTDFVLRFTMTLSSHFLRGGRIQPPALYQNRQNPYSRRLFLEKSISIKSVDPRSECLDPVWGRFTSPLPPSARPWSVKMREKNTVKYEVLNQHVQKPRTLKGPLRGHCGTHSGSWVQKPCNLHASGTAGARNPVIYTLLGTPGARNLVICMLKKRKIDEGSNPGSKGFKID